MIFFTLQLWNMLFFNFLVKCESEYQGEEYLCLRKDSVELITFMPRKYDLPMLIGSSSDILLENL